MAFRHQRFLLAFTSQLEDANEPSDAVITETVLVSFAGVLCLITVALMCMCKQSEQKKEEKDLEHQPDVEKQEKKSMVIAQGTEAKAGTVEETAGVDSTAECSNAIADQSIRVTSGSANIRPASSRELPVPPVSTDHPRNKFHSGLKVLDTVVEANASDGNTDCAKPSLVLQQVNDQGKEKAMSHDYAHLGPMPTATPSDYNIVEVPEVSNEAKHRPSRIEGAADVDYSQAKEEDPYNLIGESDGTVSVAFIHKLKQSRDLDNPYELIQGDSAGDIKSILSEGRTTEPEISSLPGHTQSLSSTTQNERNVVDDYAVIHKIKGATNHVATENKPVSNNSDASSHNTAPPEPPRVYDDHSNSVDSTGYKKANNYSKVTARESLASMSLRDATNPYEMIPDPPDSTYTMIDVWSRDASVTEGGAAGGTKQSRVTKNRSNYSEIGIFEEDLGSMGSNSNHSTSSNGIVNAPPILVSLKPNSKSESSDGEDGRNNSHLVPPDKQRDNQDYDTVENDYSKVKKVLPSARDSAVQTGAKNKSGDTAFIPNYEKVEDTISSHRGNAERGCIDPDYETVGEAEENMALLKREEHIPEQRNSSVSSQSGASSEMD